MLHLLLKNVCIFTSFPSIFPASCLPYWGGSRIFVRRGCTRLLLYFNTNKPHSFFFLQNTNCIRKPQVISGEGGGVRTPCTLPLDPPLPLPYPSGPLFSRAAVPLCHTPQARFLFSFYRLFFLSTVSLLVECLSTSSCREEGLAQRTESRV